MKNIYKLFLLTAVLLMSFLANAQNEVILFEAEAGKMGSDFITKTEGEVTYIACQTDGAQSSPENENRIVSYNIEFSAAGQYDLYVRLRVGAGGANDDSFFYGSSFGAKDASDASNWIIINNIHNIGFTDTDDVVTGTDGIAQTEVWKWINISKCDKQMTPVSFTVPEGELKQTILIGAREDGLQFDKFAFGLSDQEYTVSKISKGTSGSDPDTNEPETTHPIAHGKWKFLGSCHSGAQSRDFSKYFNQITSENGGKWGSVERTRDVMNWNDLDAAYNLAKNNGMLFKMHTMIWGSQQPEWIEKLSPEEQYEEILEWYDAVSKRYPDIDLIEVVNEPLHAAPRGDGKGNYIEALGGNGTTGWDWIVESFRLAREYFPNSLLMINDYGIVNDPNQVKAYSKIINILKKENLIDGVGMQTHAFNNNANSSRLKQSLDDLAKLELPLFATELDINFANDQEQLKEYKRIIPIFWEHKAVHGITLWGYRSGTWQKDAYLIKADGSERPAMTWLRDYIENTELEKDSIENGIFEQNNQFTVYPNPVSDNIINIEGASSITEITMFDTSGKIINQYGNRFNDDRLVIELNVAKGMYILQFSEKQKTYYRKIIVQ